MELKEKIREKAVRIGNGVYAASSDAFAEVEARNNFYDGSVFALRNLWHPIIETPDTYINKYGYVSLLINRKVENEDLTCLHNVLISKWSSIIKEYGEEARYCYVSDLFI